ncbi:hypothetical protein GQ53DRAFT_746448 [Thozetella sp. PMI_491]|nr:hypothetical protein GQ53DRAFT_746448 [Thozetella sp. PMI_491]
MAVTLLSALLRGLCFLCCMLCYSQISEPRNELSSLPPVSQCVQEGCHLAFPSYSSRSQLPVLVTSTMPSIILTQPVLVATPAPPASTLTPTALTGGLELDSFPPLCRWLAATY